MSVCDPLAPDYDPDLCAQQQAGPAPSSGGAPGGSPGSAPAAPGGSDTAFAPSGFNLSVDLYETLNKIADQYGVPAGYLAGAIYYNRAGGFGTGKNEVSAEEINRFAESLSGIQGAGPAGQGSWSAGLAKLYGSGRASLIEQLVPKGVLDPRAVTSPRAVTGGTGGTGGTAAAKPIIPGLSDDAAYAVQRVADSLFIQYLGRVPTPQEYINMSKSGWNSQQTEDWLRALPYGDSGATVGQKNDLRQQMESVYQKVLGRMPTPEEINFAAVNKIPLTDIQALAEQTRDGTVWHGDPTSYTDARTSVLDAFRKYGVSMTPQQLAKRFPNIVNQAVDGTMTDDQIDSLVSALPAPGLDGVDLGDAHRVRGLAKQWKDAYLPGQPLTDSEIKMFTKMSSTDIRDYYESLPLSMQRSIAGAQNITQFGQQVPGAPGPALPPQVAASSTTTPPAAVAGAPATAPAPAAPVPAAPNPQSKPNPLAGMDSVGHGSLVRDA